MTGAPSPSCCAPAVTSMASERVRFTSPHPKDFTDDVIAAMAETPNVMPSIAYAAAVRIGRDTRARCAVPTAVERYLGIIDKVRAAMPEAAITTDVDAQVPLFFHDRTAHRPRSRPTTYE